MVFRTFVNWYTGRLIAHPTVTRSITAGLLLGVGDATSQYVFEDRKSWERFQVARTVQMTAYGFVVLGPILHSWYTTMDRVMVSERIVRGRFKNPIFAVSSRLLLAQRQFTARVQQQHAKQKPLLLWHRLTRGARRPFDLALIHMPINALLRIMIDQVTVSPVTIMLFFVTMTSATHLRHRLLYQGSSATTTSTMDAANIVEGNDGSTTDAKATNIGQLLGECYELSLDRLRFSFTDTFINGLKVWPFGQIFNFTIVPPLYRVLYANCISLCWNAYLSYKQQEQMGSSPSSEIESESGNDLGGNAHDMNAVGDVSLMLDLQQTNPVQLQQNHTVVVGATTATTCC